MAKRWALSWLLVQPGRVAEMLRLGPNPNLWWNYSILMLFKHIFIIILKFHRFLSFRSIVMHQTRIIIFCFPWEGNSWGKKIFYFWPTSCGKVVDFNILGRVLFLVNLEIQNCTKLEHLQPIQKNVWYFFGKIMRNSRKLLEFYQVWFS